MRAMWQVLNTVLNACAKAGDTERALEIYHSVLDRGVCPDPTTINTLIHAAAKVSESDCETAVAYTASLQLTLHCYKQWAVNIVSKCPYPETHLVVELTVLLACD